MTCDDAQLNITSAEDSGELREHLASCPACAAFVEHSQRLLADAALPPVSAAERAALSPLATAAHGHWLVSQRRGQAVRRVVSLAMAACFGAAVASAALLPRAAVTAAPSGAEVPEWSLPMLTMNDVSPTSDEELEFEVSWPTAEGDVP